MGFAWIASAVVGAVLLVVLCMGFMGTCTELPEHESGPVWGGDGAEFGAFAGVDLPATDQVVAD